MPETRGDCSVDRVTRHHSITQCSATTARLHARTQEGACGSAPNANRFFTLAPYFRCTSRHSLYTTCVELPRTARQKYVLPRCFQTRSNWLDYVADLSPQHLPILPELPLRSFLLGRSSGHARTSTILCARAVACTSCARGQPLGDVCFPARFGPCHRALECRSCDSRERGGTFVCVYHSSPCNVACSKEFGP